ncbi:MAG: phospholipid/cholesterol/gamma-HCH transport system ATP-binding protein [Chlamydiales bacterium]|jgi:phospholipid/cholesterol/gamma-HCH transport system ATP-binding protein
MINIKGLWKQYGKLQVLKGLDLFVKKGETLVILGRSGVGKSVLLKQIIGIEKPDAGSVEIENCNIVKMKEAERSNFLRGMGMLFQGAALFDSMTVRDNTAFHLMEHGNVATGEPYSESEIDDLVAEVLESVDLAGTQNKMPSDLSGGMRKRAGLARIIVYRPKILLYDEPTTGLDPITATQISDIIIGIQKELDATSIVVTHDIRSALRVADRLAIHHDGRILHVAKKEEFFQIDEPLIQSFISNAFPEKGTFANLGAAVDD